jgi:superfamily II DNA or RNA helicase
MASIEKKDKVQREALANWLKANKIGTCEIVTGLGKTFIGLHALYTMPKNKDVHLFLAETTDRERDLNEQIQIYNKIFGRNVYKDYNLKFFCYQTAFRWKNYDFGLVISDEIHDSLSPEYSAFYFNNNYKALIGLSATITRNTKYEIGDKVITKGDYLDKIAPVCFKYGVKESKRDNTSRELDIYVIYTELEKDKKTVKGGSKAKPFMQTEIAAYDYWDKTHKRSFFIEDEEKRARSISGTAKRRSEIIYNSRDKIAVTRKLLDNLEGKTIIFGNTIDSLLQVTPNTISSRNSATKNENIRRAFEANKIKAIGSFKKLKQGANLTGLDNCIIMSYYGSNKDLIQRIGRLRDNGEIGKVFILLLPDSQEEIWFTKMMEGFSNFKMIHCPNVDYCIKKITK